MLSMTPFRMWLDNERGRMTWLAGELGITQPAVSQWADSQIPAERIFRISELTKIPLSKLRPDLVTDKGTAA
jgi:DNA-binding transcriptional regulator YdaS (Cro superfamily)